jgi:hypothetical protein
MLLANSIHHHYVLQILSGIPPTLQTCNMNQVNNDYVMPSYGRGRYSTVNMPRLHVTFYR